MPKCKCGGELVVMYDHFREHSDGFWAVPVFCSTYSKRQGTYDDYTNHKHMVYLRESWGPVQLFLLQTKTVHTDPRLD